LPNPCLEQQQQQQQQQRILQILR